MDCQWVEILTIAIYNAIIAHFGYILFGIFRHFINLFKLVDIQNMLYYKNICSNLG